MRSVRVRVLALSLALALVPSCKRCGVERAKSSPEPERGSAVVLDPAPKSKHAGPRLLLDAATRARLKSAAEQRSPAWRVVSALCDEAAAQDLDSGYQGFQWADAVASTSLCWHASGDARYARAALRYLGALLDDRFRIGDRAGGEGVVRHDSGYGIRTFGAYSALAFDWLRTAPGMDARLRARVAQRLEQWLDWYARDGYLKDHVFSNYYWGYLTTLGLSGLACSGATPSAARWLSDAKSQLENSVLPAFRDRLVGGGWPEGWQYGEYTAMEIALLARAFATGAGLDVAGKLPWLETVVPHHVHAQLPDGRSVYDGGTWGEHPAPPSSLAVTGVLLVAKGKLAAEARYLTRHLLPPLTREHAWLRLLTDDPSAPERDPRAGARTSLHLPGQGLTFARQDWQRQAVWTSFQAGPFLAADHQDKDQGHFELWRGSDGLLVDGGDAEGSATINHNTLLIDDHGRHMNYTPNQGVWGKDVQTTRFGDDGAVMVAVGELSDAYAPKCASDGCARSVESLTRTFVYVRPALVVIDDQIALERDDYGATWAAHTTVAPSISGDRMSAVVGSSRVDIRVLEPDGVTRRALREPTASGEGPHRQNHPWGPMWRIELSSPLGRRDRAFTTVISAGRADGPVPPVVRVRGAGLHGGVATVGGHSTAVLFAGSEGRGHATLGVRADQIVVVGLEPRRRYRLTAELDASCFVSLRLAPDPAGLTAASGGFVRVRPHGCTPR